MQHHIRRIVVIRHAKAEPDAATDAARALTARGHEDAREGGRWLAAQGVTPDRALVSGARRTLETWASLAAGAGWSLEPDVEAGLYTASADTVLDLLRVLPDDVGTALVLGHNPTMGTVAQLLDDGSGEDTAGHAMLTGFPTCAIAVFGYDGAWSDLAFPSASLTAFHVGRA